jgi:hypothetical protein
MPPLFPAAATVRGFTMAVARASSFRRVRDMTPFNTILTHPGSAHKDEFLACCVLLAGNAVSILRREPEPQDLADPDIAVVDVGHVHDPALNNFDHHQLPRDHPPTCSLSLVLRHLGLYDDAREFCDWLEPAEWFDCRGPTETARWLGVERDIVSKLNSPVDGTLLRRFAQLTRLEPGEPLWEIMRLIGDDLLTYIRSLRERITFIGRHAEVWTLDQIPGSPGVLFLPRTDPLPDDPSAGVDRYLSERGLHERIHAIVTPDRRNAGYGLSRNRDNPRLDFTRISDEPDVHFAHARGFVAKTTATAPSRIRELLHRAATPA